MLLVGYDSHHNEMHREWLLTNFARRTNYSI